VLKVLVVGGGAREHALVWKLSQSPAVAQIFTAPGNAGTGLIAENVGIKPADIGTLARFVEERKIDLTVVGPEAPLAAGIADMFQARGLPVFGPTKGAAEIEASKVFSKELMQRHGIPTARSEMFTSFGEAKDYVNSQPFPIVIKADGLAAGKGAIVAGSAEEALEALSEVMERRVFGDAGNRVLVEECLNGKEVSLLALTDGEAVVPMMPACDYKRVGDGDEGPNTGGMGSYCPPGFFGGDMIEEVQRTVLEPTVRALAEEGRRYKGVLYAGLMITADGPKVIEFNARFGDPETQAILPLLKGDLAELMMAVFEERLAGIDIAWSGGACVGVVLASGGYPGKYETGLPINGLDAVDKDIVVFHAGTKYSDGSIVTDGGRVLTVVGTGRDISDARERVYANIPRIQFEGCHYRRDIGLREVAR